MIDAISRAYALFEQLNVSMTTLIVVSIILSLAFLFAVREAAAWFFKIDDLKKDVKRLRETTLDLEAEIRALHGVLGQARQAVSLNVVPTPKSSEPTFAQEETAPSKTGAAPSGFPIVH